MSFDLITLSFFLLFLGFLLVCIIRMFFCLLRLGDERRQMIVGKACTFSFTGTVGYLLLSVLRVLPWSNRPAQSPNHPFHRRHSFHLQPGLVPAEAGRVTMENRIRALRKSLGLSQEELAKGCGVSRQTINAIENNKYDPSLALAFHLARELETTVDALFIPVP